MYNKILYLGLDPGRFERQENLVHYPIIAIKPTPVLEMAADLALMPLYSHIICTSRTVVSILTKMACLEGKCILAIGKATAALLKEHQLRSIVLPKEEVAESMIEKLAEIHTPDHYYFYPHSARSRPAIQDFLFKQGFRHRSAILYNTVTQKIDPLPNLDDFCEIVFTSPSTVDAFCEVFGSIPVDKKISAIGPVTEEYLNNVVGKKIAMSYG